tara:strand:+ start:467 stop:811 length:345 start_codon:yes stop_codon:yes gene_type:complete
MAQAFKLSFNSKFGFISESVHYFTSYEINPNAKANGCAVTGSVWLDKAAYTAASQSLLTYHFTFTPTFGAKADAIDVQAYTHLRTIDLSKGNTTNFQDSEGGSISFDFTKGINT